MSLHGTKTFFSSVTVWGALGAMLFGLFDLIGVANDPALRDEIKSWLINIGTMVFAGIAIWGRVRATSRIGTPSSGGYVPPSIALAAMLVMGAGAGAGAGGCAKDAESRWLQARDTLTQTQNQIVRGNKTGLIADEDFVALDAIRAAVKNALDRAERQLPQGGPAFDFWMNFIEETLSQLERLEKAEAHDDGTGIRGGPGGDSRRAAGDAGGDRAEGLHPAAGVAGRAGRAVHLGAGEPAPRRGRDLRRGVGCGAGGCPLAHRATRVVAV